MKTKKAPGGVLGRNLKHFAKIKNFAFIALFAIAILLIGGAFNDLIAGTIGAAVSVGGLKIFTAITPFVPFTLKGDETEEQKKEIAEKNFVGKLKYECQVAMEAATAEKISKLESELKEAIKNAGTNPELKSELEKVALDLKALKEEGKSPVKFKSVRDQIKEQLEAKKDIWNKFKSEKKGMFELEIDFKAAGTMTVAGNTNSDLIGRVQLEPGFIDLVRNRPLLESYANVASTNASVIKWTEKKNPDGNAQFIGEGDVKPLIDWDWVKNSTEAKKVADKVKVSEEMIDDIDFMAAEIENELRYQVDIAVDNGLLSGDGLGDNLKGITEYAGAYVLTTILTVDANNSDAIMAAAAQIKSLNFMADYAFVNPIDFANMSLQKSSTGEYVIPPFQTADGMTVAGVKVVESNQIPVGYVLVGDMTRFKVRNYKPFTVRYGWVDDDFEKNLITIIGERRLHDFVADNHTGAFVYDTFANIKTAITLP